MSRAASIGIEYSSNLAQMRQDWDDFVSYAEQHQPTINGVPIAQSMSPEAQKTATTFGGIQTVAAQAAQYVPQFMQPQFQPAQQQQPTSIPLSSSPRPFPGVQYSGMDTPPPPGPRSPVFTSFAGPRGSFGGTPLGISGIVPQGLAQQPQVQPREQVVRFAKNDPITQALTGEMNAPKALPTPGVTSPAGETTAQSIPQLIAAEVAERQKQLQLLGQKTKAIQDDVAATGKAKTGTTAGDTEHARWDKARLRTDLKMAPDDQARIGILRDRQKGLSNQSPEFEKIEGDIADLESKQFKQFVAEQRRTQRVTARRVQPGGASTPRIDAFGRETNAYLSSGEATPEHEAFAQRMIDARLSGADPSGGPASFLRQIGLPRAARFLGPLGVAVGTARLADAAIGQQNRYNIAAGTANSSNDIIAAQFRYQEDTPIASVVRAVPFIGPPVAELGMGIREFATHERAGIAATQVATGRIEQIGDIVQQESAASLSRQLTIASAGGDFAGQRRAIELSRLANVQGQNAANAPRIGELSQTIAAIQDAHQHGFEFRGQRNVLYTTGLSAEEAINVSSAQSEMQALKGQNKVNTANQQAIADAQQAALGRVEKSFVVASQSRIKAMGLQFSDVRGAAAEGVRGEYAARVESLLPGSMEQQQAQREGVAALGTQSLGFYRADYFAGRELQVGASQLQARQLSNQGFEYTARYAGINAQGQAAQLQFEKETAGVPKDSAQFFQAVTRLSQALSGLSSDAEKVGRDFRLTSARMTGETESIGLATGGFNLTARHRGLQARRDFEIGTNPEMADQLRARYDALEQQVDVENNWKRFGLQASASAGLQGIGGNTLAARMTMLNAQRQITIGHDRENADVIGQQFDVLGLQAQHDDAMQKYNVGFGTRQIIQSTQRQRMLNDLNPLSARQQGIIDETSNAIVRAGVDLPGEENRQVREQRITALRGSGAEQLKYLDRQLEFSGHAQSVNATFFRGDPNNRSFMDVTRAEDISARANQQFDTATGEASTNPANQAGGWTEQRAVEAIQYLRQMAIGGPTAG